MTNGQILCSKLKALSESNALSSPFRFDEVLRIAKDLFPDATSAGHEYATLKSLQSCCTSEVSEFGAFRQCGDPRKFSNCKDVKKTWTYDLAISEVRVMPRHDEKSKRKRQKGGAKQGKLSNQEVCNLVSKIFQDISAATTLGALDSLVKDTDLKKWRMSDRKYPEITFNITGQEIEQLRESGRLDENGRLQIASERTSTLEKLLYALVWKNGDFGKEHHIIRGIESSSSSEAVSAGESGIVFYHFGRYLADRDNPIIDQHVIRSFRLYRLDKAEDDWDSNVSRLRSKKDVDEETIRDYEEWLASLPATLRAHAGYRFHVDKVLFALGRAVKA